MDINALRVFNSLYGLSITEPEFAEIEDEQSHKERAGLSIVAVKSGNLIIGVSHDDRHDIIVKNIRGSIAPKPHSRVLFKTLITFSELPQEIHTLHQIAQYRALDDDIRHIATNLDELKDRICDRFADGYPKELGEVYDEVNCGYGDRKKNAKLKAALVEKQLKALFWLFGEDYGKTHITFARKNIPRIIKVFSHNNRRVAIIQENQDYDKERGGCGTYKWHEHITRTTLRIQTFTPSDGRYNYVSPNREIYLAGYGKPNVWLDDNLFEKVAPSELKVLSSHLQERRDWLLLTADEYNRQKAGIRIEMMSAKRSEMESQARKDLAAAIQKQYKAGKVVRHGITFRKGSISYEGITLKGGRVGEYVEQKRIILLERPDFNSIYEGYVEYILELEPLKMKWQGGAPRTECRLADKETLSVGAIQISIQKKGKLYYVNRKRIGGEDVCPVVQRAIHFDNQKAFDGFVADTSRVNLSLQNVLKQGGMSYELKIDATDDNCLLKKEGNFLLSIPIKRQEGKNYATIKGREFKVINMKALFELKRAIERRHTGRLGYLQRTIKLLYRAIDGISPKDIGDLIRDGKAEYARMVERAKKEEKERTDRSRAFLAHAVSLTQAQKVKGGYIVKGLSGTGYFVDEKNDGVWTLKDGKQDKYLCIVDMGEKAEGEAGLNDTIAQRLLALAKDKLVAREIWEKGDKMDRHWLNIQEMQESEVA